MFRSLTGLIYLIVGFVVANSHHYLSGINSLRELVSAVLAVTLWPLILLGISLHVR